MQVIGRQMLLRIGYRGYLQVFTGNEICYYLGTRFYSPTLGRFLNADVYQDTMQGVVGTNMFAYCNNNPVIMCDPEGTEPTTNERNESVSSPFTLIIMKKDMLRLCFIVSKGKTPLHIYSVHQTAHPAVLAIPLFGGEQFFFSQIMQRAADG